MLHGSLTSRGWVPEPFLSVVVPVYNVESYLPELFGSLAGLEGRSVEVLFVEDCSTDNSAARLADYVAASPLNARILRHKENRGLSAARNTGIAEARGTYVWFVDSDDMINPLELGAWFSALETNLPDVLVFDFINFGDGFVVDTTGGPPVMQSAAVTSRPVLRRTSPDRLQSKPHQLMVEALRDLRMHAWSYCFKRSLLPPDPFPVGRVYEDLATIPLILHAAETVYYHPAPLIYYRNRPDSISKKVTAKRDLDLAQSMQRDWQKILQDPNAFTEQDIVAYLATWLKTLLWAINNLHDSSLLDDDQIFNEYAACWKSYRRAAGWRHLSAMRSLPRPTIATRLAALALTVSLRLVRAVLHRIRPRVPVPVPVT